MSIKKLLKKEIFNSLKRLLVFLFPLLISCFTSCKKLVEVTPPSTSLTSDNVYTNDATAAAVLTGIYTSMALPTPLGGGNVDAISLVCGLSADELTLYGGAANANSALAKYYLNNLTSGSSTTSGLFVWNDLYGKLYIVNLALERLAASNSLTPAVKQQLLGEAKFLRAFFYFYLVNLYGDLPLSTTSDYRVNSTLSRSSQAMVYQQIISDLKDAEALLCDGYVTSDAKSGTVERLRPNKWAATALLARVYLYISDWSNAEIQASAVINNTDRYDTVSLNSIFLKNSREAIWQLQPVNSGWNTEDARFFILPATGPTINFSGAGYPVYLSSQFSTIFEPGDQRKINWIDSVTVNVSGRSQVYYFPFKYKSAVLNAPVTEYLMVMRLGEQFLIRAEARAQQNNVVAAQSDINMIRIRAGLFKTASNDKASLLTAVNQQRQAELFTEWGHRWLDIKRTGQVDVIMKTAALSKGTTWNTSWQWYPVPLFDIKQDPNMVQNSGYGN